LAQPGQKLNFSDDNLRTLGGSLRELIEELDAQQAQLRKRIDVWWDWYEAKPQVAVRNDPWPNASNVVVPLIRTHSDGIAARYINTVFASNNIWSARTQNEVFKERFLPHVPDFVNWAARGNEFDLFMPALDGINEMVPIGAATWQLTWDQREKFVFLPGQGGRPRAQRVTLSRGPVITHIPLDQIQWQPGRSIEDSEYVSKQVLLTWGDLVRHVQTDDWDADAVEASKGSPDRNVTDRIRSQLEAEGISIDGPEGYQLHDVREILIDWPMLRGLGVSDPGRQETDDRSVPLLVTLHKETGSILRVIAYPYALPHWNFYEVYFRKRSARGSGAGVAKMLEHLQRAATTLVNQSIDAVTLANSLNSKTTDPKLLSQPWSPNKPLLLDQMDDFEPISLNKIITPDLALMNALFAMAERLTGISDPVLGRETRLGGHPSPATSTLALLQEGSKLFASGLKVLRRQLSRMGEDIAALYQQFETDEDGRIIRALGPSDGEAVRTWLFPTPEDGLISGNLEFDLHALSEINNPQVEQQRAILLDQLTANYYARVLQFLQIIESPQAQQLVKGAAVRGLEALTNSYTKVLEASEIDEIEDFVFKLKESNNDPRVIRELGDAAINGAGGLQGAVQGGAVVPSTENALNGPLASLGGTGEAR
jgi:hypothetical protein